MSRTDKRTLLSTAVLACWLFAELGAAARDARADPQPIPGQNVVVEDRKTCGQNALYALLRLNGKDVQHEEVLKALPASPSGTSLEELRACAATFGVDLDAIKAIGDDLERLPLPAIVHTGANSAHGHYLVLVALYDPGYPRFIDGTSGETIDWNRAEFLRYWTGHALVIHKTGWSKFVGFLPLIVFALGIAAAIATIWNLWKDRLRPIRPHK